MARGPATLEIQNPRANGGSKRPFERIVGELPDKMLEANRAAKGSVWVNGPVNISGLHVELCLARHLATIDA